MSTFTQQDAQEYYSRILDELEKEVTKASRSKRRTSVSWAEATKSLTLPETGGDEKEGEKKEVEEKSDAPEEQPRSRQTLWMVCWRSVWGVQSAATLKVFL